MKRIIVASQNPVKLQATRRGFERMFTGRSLDVVACSVPSGVKEQPTSDAETLQGAINRARNAAERERDADFWVGIEGGVEERAGQMMAFAWVVIQDSTVTGNARSGAFVVPEPVATLVRDGKELGEADDIVFDRSGSKRDAGAVGLLTDRVIDRTQLYEQAVILALVPINKPDLYQRNRSA